MNNEIKKNVPTVVIRRLPRYYRYLEDLLKNNIIRISSTELAKKMNITASQVRQDFSCFGGFGQQGYGYNVENLYNEIGNLLGLRENYTTVIVGAGNLGRALANHASFDRRGFKLVGIFDIDERIIGKKINNITVMHADELDKFVAENRVDIGIITVPRDNVKDVANKLISLGIKGLWNFSYIELKGNDDVQIENVHLTDSLMTLSYNIKKNSQEN